VNVPESWKLTFDEDLLEGFLQSQGEDTNNWNLQLLSTMQLNRNLARLCRLLKPVSRSTEEIKGPGVIIGPERE
jgi:hypothetical protein